MSFEVGRVSWREWTGLGSGLLAAGALFLPWTTLSAPAGEVEDALKSLPADEIVRNAWSSGFLAWCPPILLLVIGLAVVVFGQFPKIRVSGLPQLWLVGTGGVLLLTVVGWYTISLQFGSDERALFAAGGISISASFGRYIALAATIVSLCTALLDARAARAESRLPVKKTPLKDRSE